jgi:branched-chain amino acid transport system substrate-binding protein
VAAAKLAAIASLTAAVPALADITIGVSLPLTGPASGLGIPMGNQFKLWPATIAGEKVNLIILDDATDPTKGVQNAKPLRHRGQGRHDHRLGSPRRWPARWPRWPPRAKTVQLAAPGGPAARQDAWTFRLPQSNRVMAHAMVEHMKKHGVKTVGFLGYTDAYGELWLKASSPPRPRRTASR